jgi:hypothetical protein
MGMAWGSSKDLQRGRYRTLTVRKFDVLLPDYALNLAFTPVQTRMHPAITAGRYTHDR